jgi:hypothetical protein
LNLTRKKARVSLIASATAALVASGGLLALSAHAAPTPLTLNSGGTTPVVANLGVTSTALAATAYALKITGADEAVRADLVSAPTGGSLAVDYKAANAAADATFEKLAASTVSLDEIQVISTGGATGGTFSLTFDGQTATGIAFGATAGTVQTALDGLSSTPNNADIVVTGAAGGPYTLTFSGAGLDDTNVPQVTIGGGSLTGGGAVINRTSVQGGPDASIGDATTIDNTYYEYITADVPGTYTLRFFQDTNTNNQLDAADERATELITMTVLDAGGTGTTAATTADDVSPIVSATTPTTKGLPITASITYNKSLSTADARGSNVAAGLKAALAALTWIDIDPDATLHANGSITDASDQAATYTASTGAITRTVGPATIAGTVTLRADLRPSAGDNASYGTKTVEITDNGTTTLTLDATNVVGKVKETAGAVKVKSGQGVVTYTATATDAGSDPVDGAVVYFTLAGTDVESLTTNGTAVAGQEDVYTATTNSDGIASLAVTSSATEAADTYTVDADTNNANVVNDPLTVTYEDATVTTVESLNTAAELAPEASAGSVTLKGKLVDQFAGTYQPSSSQVQQVGIEVPDGTNVAFVTPTSGTFTYTYTPATAPTAGTSLSYDFQYSNLNDANSFAAGTINWASSTAAAAITFTTPNTDATGVKLANHLDAAPAQLTGSDDFGDADAEVTGIVRDSSGTALPHKRVTLTGSDGVWFSDATTGADLQETIDVVSDSSGQFDGAFAIFTKSGDATITATAGTAIKDVTVTTADPVAASAFKVIAIDAAGTPGSTLVVTGKLTDFFGNGVPNKQINLSTGSSTVGSLSDTSPDTNSEGVWSTTFISGANQSGDVTLTATIAGQTENEEPVDFWTDADGPGLTGLPEHGEYTDQATIKIEEEIVTLEATAVVVGGGKAFLSGMTRPNANVDIYIKPLGQATFALFDVVKADAEGEFGTSKNIVRSTLWLAKVGDLSSTVELTSVQSKVTIGTRALGNGRVVVAADGAPNAKATLRFYQVAADGKIKLIRSVGASAKGYGSFIWKTTPGAKKIRVYYQAPGTRRGQAEKIQVVT